MIKSLQLPTICSVPESNEGVLRMAEKVAETDRNHIGEREVEDKTAAMDA